MRQIDKQTDEPNDPVAFADAYLERLGETLRALDTRSIGRFAKILIEASECGARIFFIGNGGSAATVSHFANDLAIGTQAVAKPFRAISLVDNVAILTAIANDDGYDEVFVQQLRAHLTPGDVVVAISASGNSANVVDAVRYANDHGAVTVGLTGFGGGALRTLVGHNVHVPSQVGEYGPVEDAHLVVNHLVGAYLRDHVRRRAVP